MDSQVWGLILNLLKLLGAALTGIAAIIGILSDTRTPDKRQLTRAGRALLLIGIVGLGTALIAQVVEWIKGAYDAEEAQAQNRVVLSEIRRAVTRFDTVSYDVYVDLPLDKPGFSSYSRHLETRIRKLLALPYVVDLNRCYSGVKLILKPHDRDWGDAQVQVCLDGLPNDSKDKEAAIVVRKFPIVMLYRNPIQVTGVARTEADLILAPGTGETTPSPILESQDLLARNDVPSLTANLSRDGSLKTLTYSVTGVRAPKSRWAPSGKLVSMEDLQGAEALIFVPGINGLGGHDESWRSTSVRAVFYFNNYRIIPKGNAAPFEQGFEYTFYEDDLK